MIGPDNSAGAELAVHWSPFFLGIFILVFGIVPLLVLFSATNSTETLKTWITVTMIGSLLVSLLFVRLAILHEPVYRINQEGMVLKHYGLAKWKNITDVKPVFWTSGDWLAIRVDNFDELIAHQPGYRKVLSWTVRSLTWLSYPGATFCMPLDQTAEGKTRVLSQLEKYRKTAKLASGKEIKESRRQF